MKSTLIKLENWHAAGHVCRLAVVVETWGSAPRPVGSMLAIATPEADGQMLSEGSVSSGCVEGDVMAAALALNSGDKPQLLEFGISQEAAWAASLTCGGTIRVLVLPVNTSIIRTLRKLADATSKRRATALTIDLASAEMMISESTHSQPTSEIMRAPDGSLTSITLHYPPLPRLVISGMGHLTEQVARAALLCDFDIWIIDPRPAFTDGKKIDGITVSEGWPDEVLTPADIDPLTAMLALSHDPKIDDPLLGVGLNSESFYVGALGSTRSHANRLERLAKMGFTADQCARIHGPVGMDIKAKGAGEIAMSIVADIIRAFRATTSLSA